MNTVYLTREFDQPPEVVFNALTNPDYITQWFGPPNMYTRKAEVNLKKGGRYIFYLERDGGDGFNIEGIYREIVPPPGAGFYPELCWNNHEQARREPYNCALVYAG